MDVPLVPALAPSQVRVRSPDVLHGSHVGPQVHAAVPVQAGRGKNTILVALWVVGGGLVLPVSPWIPEFGGHIDLTQKLGELIVNYTW